MASQESESITVNRGSAAQSQRELQSSTPPGATGTAAAPATGSKRARYAARACEQCQQRKVKCSGEQPGPCQNCQTAGLRCAYQVGPRKRRGTKAQQPPVNTDAVNALLGAQSMPPGRSVTSVPVEDLLSRLVRLENDLAQERRVRETTLQLIVERQSGDAQNQQQSPNGPSGDLRNGSLVHAQAGQTHDLDVPQAARVPCSFADRRSLPPCCRHDLMLTSSQRTEEEIEQLTAKVRRYFDGLAFHYPCLNESQTLAQLHSYVTDQETDAEPNIDTVQFVALIHLIEAWLAILETDCTVADELPGWDRLQQASHLLAHTAWLADGNILTIQCLIVKALYLLFALEYRASYSAVGEAVRICYLIGLHAQPRHADSSPFEMHIRQRTFWSLYCLERKVSQSCRAPYLIRDSEIQIDLPACLDDKLIGGSEQLPDEDPDLLSIPYLRSTVKWARLSGETWDKVFCINAPRPVEEEVMVTMDAKIENLRRRFPRKLQWSMECLTGMQTSENSPPPAPLAMILHLRTNQLRLQLRQSNKLSPEFRDIDLGTCLALATDTTNVVHDFAAQMDSSNRFSCATYMQDAIFALAGIILDSNVDERGFEAASGSFKRALAVLSSFAPKLKAARVILKQFERLILDVGTKIKNETPAERASEGSANGAVGFHGQTAYSDTGLGTATDLWASMGLDLDTFEDDTLRNRCSPAFGTTFSESHLMGM